MLTATNPQVPSPSLDSSMSYDEAIDAETGFYETPLQLLPQLDGSFLSDVRGDTSPMSSQDFASGPCERSMLLPGAIIKGPWTREV